MKNITNEQRLKILDRACNKGKHKPFENLFGITWCTTCGVIMKDCVPTNAATHLPENTNEPIFVTKMA